MGIDDYKSLRHAPAPSSLQISLNLLLPLDPSLSLSLWPPNQSQTKAKPRYIPARLERPTRLQGTQSFETEMPTFMRSLSFLGGRRRTTMPSSPEDRASTAQEIHDFLHSATPPPTKVAATMPKMPAPPALLSNAFCVRGVSEKNRWLGLRVETGVGR